MVLVSVCTMGTSFVAISVFWAANVSDIVTISVFTTGGWGGRRERSEGGGKRVNTIYLRQLGKHVGIYALALEIHFKANQLLCSFFFLNKMFLM